MTEPFVYVASISAGLAGLVYIGKQARNLWRWGRGLARMVDAIHGLVEHELQPNSGGSLYDMVKRIDVWREDHVTESEGDRASLAEVRRFIGLD
jgi:hypothetical protein